MSDAPPITDAAAIDRVRAQFLEEFARAGSERDLRAVRDLYLGRKGGIVAALMKAVGTAPADQRPVLGRLANELKTEVEARLGERQAAVLDARPPADAVDVSLPGRQPVIGHRHPITLLREQIETIFTRMGFTVLEGPEVEDEYHNFEALNMPPEHPARDMQDTLYLAKPIQGGAATGADPAGDNQSASATLLRTHTSGMQIRYMETHEPPVRIIAPGRVYRRDNLDLTHTPMFQQVEGLVVGERVSLADLKGTLIAFVHQLFDERTTVRFRPSFFPYTEPSAEVDVSCIFCRGEGCAVCKRSGWLEILGSGMVHPAVFEAVGYDAERYTGFAFGMGMERIAMLKYGVEDIRMFYENDMRFLEQFPYSKILYSWLRDFVDVPVPPDALGAALSMRGFAVESLEPAPGAENVAADAVLDLEITANRPDCLSVAGIAREVAAIYSLPLRQVGARAAAPLATVPLEPTDGGDVKLTLEDAELCPRYAAAVADVRIGTSPAWMAARLHAAGVRPINNIVDVTNYVLLELGHPLHAFDLERLAGRELRIRRARQGEPITTLDGEKRTLADDMLVIADAQHAQAIGGVMGGADSEVSPATTVIALEAAWFEPASVRRTSKRLGLKTEASSRFERGADIGAPVWALERAVALIEQIGGGHGRGTVRDLYPQAPPPVRVLLRKERIARLLGLDVEASAVVRILESLGFRLEPAPAGTAAEGWIVDVPTARVDVRREADLIEEVGRHHGFEHLPATFPALVTMPAKSDSRLERDRLVRRVLTGAGYSEAITFTFIEQAAANGFGPAEDVVPIANPLSEKFAVLRPSLAPGLIESIAHNRRREQHDVRLFEVGSRFTDRGGERRMVGFACTGAVARHWSASPRAVDFFDVKGVVERVCEAFGVTPAFAPVRRGDLVPGRSALVTAPGPGGAAAAVELGYVGQLAPAILAYRDLPGQDPVYAAEIDLDALSAIAGAREVRVEPLPRYPSIVRDLSIVIDEALPAETVRGTIRAAAPDTLISVREFDRYHGKGIPQGSVSLSLRLTFRSPARTLTDAEVQTAVETIVRALDERHGVKLR